MGTFGRLILSRVYDKIQSMGIPEKMEKKCCAIYLSGTGNTKFCIEKFVKLSDKTAPVLAIEDEAALSALKN